jgi:hypothetical protein
MVRVTSLFLSNNWGCRARRDDRVLTRGTAFVYRQSESRSLCRVFGRAGLVGRGSQASTTKGVSHHEEPDSLAEKEE